MLGIEVIQNLDPPRSIARALRLEADMHVHYETLRRLRRAQVTPRSFLWQRRPSSASRDEVKALGFPSPGRRSIEHRPN